MAQDYRLRNRISSRPSTAPDLSPTDSSFSHESEASSSSGFSENSQKDSLHFFALSATSSTLSLSTIASSRTVDLGVDQELVHPRSRRSTLLSRGRNYLSIRSRLAVLSTHFPHRDRDITTVDGMDQVYGDVFELLSPTSPSKIRDRVLRLLLVQIGTRQTRYLVLALKISSLQRIRLFFSQLFAHRRAAWQHSSGHSNLPKLTDPYHSSISCEERHSAMPFVDFLSQAVQAGSLARKAILDAGFLDLLLYMHVCDFLDPLGHHGSIWERKGRNPPLTMACNTILQHLSNDNDCLPVILNHPLHILWPNYEGCLFKTGSQSEMLQQRRRTWRILDRQLLDLRFNAVYHVLSSDSESDLLDVCVDFLEFMRSDVQVMEGVDRFKLWQTFGECMAVHHTVEHTLSAHLAQYPDDEINDTFSYIFTELSRLFVNFREMSDWEYGLVEFVIDVAQHRPANKKAIISAGILPTLLPMLKVDLRYSIKSGKTILQFALFSESDPPMDFIITSRVTDTIRVHGLVPLLRHAGTQLSGRRLLLCRAFHALLIPMSDVLTILRELLGEIDVRKALATTVMDPLPAPSEC